jgi:hypothetical protein
MWEKIGKVLIVNVIALIIIITCAAITLIACFKPIPTPSKELVSLFFNMSLVGVIGWAFTQSKNSKAA